MIGHQADEEPNFNKEKLGGGNSGQLRHIWNRPRAFVKILKDFGLFRIYTSFLQCVFFSLVLVQAKGKTWYFLDGIQDFDRGRD